MPRGERSASATTSNTGADLLPLNAKDRQKYQQQQAPKALGTSRSGVSWDDGNLASASAQHQVLPHAHVHKHTHTHTHTHTHAHTHTHIHTHTHTITLSHYHQLSLSLPLPLFTLAAVHCVVLPRSLSLSLSLPLSLSLALGRRLMGRRQPRLSLRTTPGPHKTIRTTIEKSILKMQSRF